MNEEKEPVAVRRHALVPGLSAYKAGKIECYAAGVGWSLFALVIPLLVLETRGLSLASPIFISMVVLASVGMGAVTFSNLGFPSAHANDRERKAGYTTLPVPHMPALDLVHPKTGVVIRAAGEGAITKAAHRAVLRQSQGEPRQHS